MEEICDQLADRLQGDTNNLLTLTLAFPGEGPAPDPLTHSLRPRAAPPGPPFSRGVWKIFFSH